MASLIMVSVLRKPDDLSAYLLKAGFTKAEPDAQLQMQDGLYYLDQKKVEKEIVSGYLLHLRLPLMSITGTECYPLPPMMDTIQWASEMKKERADSRVLYFDGFDKGVYDVHSRTAHFFFEEQTIVQELTTIVDCLDCNFGKRRGSSTDLGYVLDNLRGKNERTRI